MPKKKPDPNKDDQPLLPLANSDAASELPVLESEPAVTDGVAEDAAPVETETEPVADVTPEPEQRVGKVQDEQAPLAQSYRNWFLEYASYVILDRAVPHIDDGLKPVQRRDRKSVV